MLPNGPAPQRLRELLPDAEVFPPATDPAAIALADEAAELVPGEAYVELDGFDCVSAALAAERGAAAIVTERLLPEISCPQLIVNDSWAAKRILETAGLGQAKSESRAPALPRLVLTSGEDETASLAATIFALSGQPTALRTARVDDDGEACRKVAGTRRPTRENWLQRSADNRMAVAFDSIDSAQDRTASSPSVVCLQSRSLPKQQMLAEGAIAVVCVDHPECVKQSATHRGLVLTFGEAEHADVQITCVEEHSAGQRVMVSHDGDSVAIDLDRPGPRRRREAAAALAIAVSLGLQIAPSARCMSCASAPLLQLERIVPATEPIVLADSARDIDQLCDTLKAADAITTGRVVVVADLSDDTSEANQQLAVLERLSDRSFVTGGTPDLDFADPSVTPIGDREGAIAVALGLADEHDVVVIAGAMPNTIEQESRWVELLMDRRASAQLTRRAA